MDSPFLPLFKKLFKKAGVKTAAVPSTRPIILRLSEQDHIDIREISSSLNYEKIHRVMLLLDTRWVNERFEAYIPDVEELEQVAHEKLAEAVLFGRAHGVAHIRDRGFTALYTRSAFGQEIVGISYILEESMSQ